MATAYLLRRVVETFKITDVSGLIERVQQVGQRLLAAQPREMATGNIVRRVLGVIREEAEEDRDDETNGCSDAGPHGRPLSAGEHDSRAPKILEPVSRALSSSPLRQGTGDQPPFEPGEDGAFERPTLLTAHASYATTNNGPVVTSMFSLLSHPRSNVASTTATPGSQSPGSLPPLSTMALANLTAAKDLGAEIVVGIQEILEELDQADDQIAGYSLEHIHSNEIILTHTSSITVQKFLLKAAVKRRFTVFHAEAFPNDHESTHATVIGKANGGPDDELRLESFQKSLTAAGITVILTPDSAVFALMSRVNKVILDTHIVLPNGGLVAAAGAKVVAKAASMHRIPVIVLSGVYKLSPVYPFDIDSLMENGDPGRVTGYEDGGLVNKIEVENPLFDYVPPELVDLYITNLGGHAPTYLYRIIADHYRTEDIEFDRISVDQ
ncbi:MAG: GCD complex subunit gcd7 [Alectoria sarmentosa]|nr:MAG: GCD complex subunit gcd7 [Alectoria sarmentosa]CAD6585947.1 MAG: GCD complex subunit gcd7 [Alectoria sarmentosa]